MCGAFLTGIFATSSISSLDGIPTIASGAWDGNGVQIAKQLAEIAAIFSWSFVLSVIMLMILKYVPGMHLRVTDEIEEVGLDLDQFDDEVVGEWGIYDTQEGHARRASHTGGPVLHGVPLGAPGSANIESGSATPPDTEQVKAQKGE